MDSATNAASRSARGVWKPGLRRGYASIVRRIWKAAAPWRGGLRQGMNLLVRADREILIEQTMGAQDVPSRRNAMIDMEKARLEYMQRRKVLALTRERAARQLEDFVE